MRKILSLCGALALAGCSSSPIPAEQAQPVPAERLSGFQAAPAGPHGSLIVTRDEGFTGGACNTQVFLDGKQAAAISSGETARFYLPPGSHIVSAKPTATCGGGLKEREVLIQANESKRYRISVDSNMGMDLSPTAF